MNALIIEATAFNESQKLSASEMQIKNILIYQSDQELNNDDTDKKYFNMNYTDKLNVLIIILHFDKQKNKVAGSTRFGNISFGNKRLEIGWTWIHPDFHGTGLNKACKFLLLDFGTNVLLLIISLIIPFFYLLIYH